MYSVGGIFVSRLGVKPGHAKRIILTLSSMSTDVACPQQGAVTSCVHCRLQPQVDDVVGRHDDRTTTTSPLPVPTTMPTVTTSAITTPMTATATGMLVTGANCVFPCTSPNQPHPPSFHNQYHTSTTTTTTSSSFVSPSLQHASQPVPPPLPLPNQQQNPLPTPVSGSGYTLVEGIARQFAGSLIRTSPVFHGKHVMLSYEWQSQSLAEALYTGLHNVLRLNVWMDIRGGMFGNINRAMAEGVEGAGVVLPLMTQSYQTSHNCEKELSYASERKTMIVPLMAATRDAATNTNTSTTNANTTNSNATNTSTIKWRPSSWLGAIVAGKLYVSFGAWNTSVSRDHPANVAVVVEGLGKLVEQLTLLGYLG